MTHVPTLHLVCGKIAAGKSTLTTALAAEPHTVLVSEDDWLAALYPDEQNSLADYLRNAARLRTPMTPHLVALLRSGVSVVLDFPANTPANRAWMRSVFETAGVAHQLHYLEASDALCKARLHRRNVEGGNPFTVSDEVFDLFTSHFVPPGADEGLNVILHPQV